MLKITKLMGILLFVITMNSCSSFKLPLLLDSNVEDTRLCATDDGTFYTCQDMKIQNKQIKSDPSLFSSNLHFNQLGEYTAQMAMDIQQDLQGTMVDGSVIVASFVYLDASLQSTGALGAQLAEYFINDLQQIGLPVSDHKLTGNLNMNRDGDIVFSRDISEIWNPMKIGYVFSGTINRNSRGVMVNARLMNFNTKGVIASSSKFIPNIILNGML
jgi:TolB-like protein